jgi:hypothetical protein
MPFSASLAKSAVFAALPHVDSIWQAHENVHFAGPAVARFSKGLKAFFNSLLVFACGGPPL